MYGGNNPSGSSQGPSFVGSIGHSIIMQIAKHNVIDKKCFMVRLVFSATKLFTYIQIKKCLCLKKYNLYS